MNGINDNSPLKDSAGALTENSAMLLGGQPGAPASFGVNKVHHGSQDAVMAQINDRNS